MTELQIGQSAPDYTSPRDGGQSFGPSDTAGKTVVLYFYPKDDTPGCTTEALDFTAAAADFAAAGAIVIGVSKDGVRKHEKFRDKHGLSIPLLSDEAGDLCERYGVWVEKSMYGRTYMGIDRSTFLIGPDGALRRIWRNVKVKGHVEEVLEAVKAL